MSSINVMLFGASRSGKTSILSSMLTASRTYLSKDYNLLLQDRTDYADGKTTLNDSKLGMENLLKKDWSPEPRLGELTGSQHLSEYRFQLTIRNVKGVDPLTVNFIDMPGENFKPTHPGYNQVCDLVKDCQILMVAVDTPSLLYADKMQDAYYDGALNCVDGLTDMVSLLGMNREEEALRLLVFVPIKCEYWVQKNRMDKIYQLIEKVYQDQIAIAKNFSKVKIMTMPVETIGGLLFDHHTEPDRMKLLAYDPDRNVAQLDKEDYRDFGDSDRDCIRCEMKSANIVTLGKTGLPYCLTEKDRLVDVREIPMHPYCFKENYPIPYAWFKPVGTYKPDNCDQLLLEVMKFMVQDAAAIAKLKVNDLVNVMCKDEYDMYINPFSPIDIFMLPVKLVWKAIEWVLKKLGVIGSFSQKEQLEAMCKAIHKMKNDKRFLNKYKVIHNSLDPDGSDFKF